MSIIFFSKIKKNHISTILSKAMVLFFLLTHESVSRGNQLPSSAPTINLLSIDDDNLRKRLFYSKRQ